MSQTPSLQLLKHLAKGIAAQFGPNCEVVVYDLLSCELEHSIVAIENGHVTGRKVGDGPSHAMLEALRGETAGLKDHLCYLARTGDGKILKSTTLYLRDDDGRLAAIFAVNYDISFLLAAENQLQQFTATGPDKRREPVSRSVSNLLDELIEQSVALVGKPVAVMNKEDKVRAIQFLNEAGAFLITKSGERVCQYFGISKYTLYSYIGESKE